MSNVAKMTLVELKLFLREPGSWLVSVFLPTAILLILGIIPGLTSPVDIFGGESFITIFVPSLVVITLATLGVNILPIRLATYREKGVLRRLSTTPVKPEALLAAQIIINMGVAIVAVLVLMLVANLAFGTPFPQDVPGFAISLFLGMASIFALGLLVSAFARTTRMGNAFALPIFFLTMFLGGVYFPRFLLPQFIIDLGNFTPPGVQAMLDAWTGTSPDPVQLAVLAAITVVAGVAAARFFRWE